jgi:hypothetical protein
LLAEKGSELGGPWSDHPEGPVRELRIRLRDVAARIVYWGTADGRMVLLTAFRKTRPHDQKQMTGPSERRTRVSAITGRRLSCRESRGRITTSGCLASGRRQVASPGRLAA